MNLFRFTYRMVLTVVGVTALLAMSANAQSTGLRGGGGGSAKGPRPPVKGQPRPVAPNGHGSVTKYVPAASRTSDDDPFGVLTMHLDDKRNVQLQVTPQVKITLGAKQLGGEELERVLLSGLLMDVAWEDTTDAKSRHVHSMRTATPTSVEVEAVVDRYEEKTDELSLRARTKGGLAAWPDQKLDSKGNPKAARSGGKVPQRKLRLKAIEGASDVMDETGHAITLADVQPGQKMRGTIVLGKNCSLIVKLQLLAPGEKFDDAPKPPGDGRKGPPGDRINKGGGGG